MIGEKTDGTDDVRVHTQKECDPVCHDRPGEGSAYQAVMTVNEFVEELLPDRKAPSWVTPDVSVDSFDVIKEVVKKAVPDLSLAKRTLVACDEILANIVSYSGAGRMGFFCSFSDSGVYIGFRDDGAAFDPTSAVIKELSFDEMEFGGMGLNIVRQEKKAWYYQRLCGENILVMVF